MPRAPLLYLNVLVIATCGLIYELIAGTLASYVLGDSVTQFSVIIGLYLSAMGVGAWLSGFIREQPARKFIDVELGVALLGGLSAPLLFLSFAYLAWFRVALYGLVFGIGVLVGLELPLLMRILRDQMDFKDLVSRVLSFDYIGALLASLVFPLLMVPTLGLVRTSILFGACNAAVALWGTYLMRELLRGRVAGLRLRAILIMAVLAVAFLKADRLTHLAEEGLFDDAIVYAETTPYQRIVVTRGASGFKLFLNGNLQFASSDEYRYHEALVHPALSLADRPEHVLILGGGDGLAAREILRYSTVKHVVLVDLDRAMTDLAREFPLLRELTRESLLDPRVEVINADAMTWLEEYRGPPFDAAIVDFPDPNSFSLGKLYTRHFYRLLQDRLEPEAPIAVQSTSPLYARTSFWCIVRTIEAAGFSAAPYQVSVPSFGVWGFVLGRRGQVAPPKQVPGGLRFLNDDVLPALFVFPSDMGPVEVEENRLDDQTLVRYYEDEWRRWQ